MVSVNNFVIDHVLRGVMTSTDTGKYMWSINQITEPSLSVTSETAEAVDALGTTIATFDRGRKAEFSANNSLFDLGLYASQMGRSKDVAASDAKITVPAFEELTGTATLKHTVKTGTAKVNLLNGDGTVGDEIKVQSVAGEGICACAGTSFTEPTNKSAGDRYLVAYEYDADGTEGNGATAVTGNAKDFPVAGKFIMEVLGTDVCNPSKLIHAFVIFPRKGWGLVA